MFHIGRYEPGNDQIKSKENKSETISHSCQYQQEEDRKVDEKVIAASIEVDDEDKNSSDSSSSAPSSDSEGESSDNDNDIEKLSNNSTYPYPGFKVIAPEQKEHSVDVMRKRLKLTNEGIDDFDHDNQKQTLFEQSEEIRRALQISQLPIKEVAKIWDLAPFLVNNLEKDGYDSFFPIQALVIPDVIASERHAHIRNRDVCVSSPTGSGKTLAFVIPVLNSLASRKIRRLRALVVLPSRDLGKFLMIFPSSKIPSKHS